MIEFTGVQQGWQCPICKRVYAPSTPMCWYCGEEGRTKTSTTTNIEYPIDPGSYSFGGTYAAEEITNKENT